MKRTLLIILLLLPALSFGRTKYISTTSEKYQRTKRENVTIYLKESEVPKNAIRIGIITTDKKKENKAYESAKDVAAYHGGNAILYTSGETLSGGKKMANAMLWPGIYKTGWHFEVYFVPGKIE